MPTTVPLRALARSLIRSASVSGYWPAVLSSSHSPARVGASRSHSYKRARLFPGITGAGSSSAPCCARPAALAVAAAPVAVQVD